MDAVAPFSCPISLETMTDPVMCADGHTYERKNIEAHFAARRRDGRGLTSPMTNLPVIDTLVPNIALRNAIDAVSSVFGSDAQARADASRKKKNRNRNRRKKASRKARGGSPAGSDAEQPERPASDLDALDPDYVRLMQAVASATQSSIDEREALGEDIDESKGTVYISTERGLKMPLEMAGLPFKPHGVPNYLFGSRELPEDAAQVMILMSRRAFAQDVYDTRGQVAESDDPDAISSISSAKWRIRPEHRKLLVDLAATTGAQLDVVMKCDLALYCHRARGMHRNPMRDSPNHHIVFAFHSEGGTWCDITPNKRPQ